jgi:peptide chain release factor 3
VHEIAGEFLANKLAEDMELLEIAGDPFDLEKVIAGQLTPVFFGSAVNNFGLQTFLEHFLKLAPSPTPRQSNQGEVQPTDEAFSGYVFKIQANMNPAHRDRIAFLRICSGKFERGMGVRHVRAGKDIKLAQPQQFMAQDRNIVDTAYPGDIIGLFDPGIFQIGDTLVQRGNLEFHELPTFSPELFAKVSIKNALKYKQYQKGLAQLAEEGTIQVYTTAGAFDDTILGGVGELQFEVFEYRMRIEYGVEIQLQRLPYSLARWIVAGGTDKIEAKNFRINSLLVKDRFDQFVGLFDNEYALRMMQEKLADSSFHETAPRITE